MLYALYIIVAAYSPRVFLFFILLLTDWVPRAYETIVWPFLGFLFAPYCTLTYMSAMLSNDRQMNGWWLALFVFSAILDVACLIATGAQAVSDGEDRDD